MESTPSQPDPRYLLIRCARVSDEQLHGLYCANDLYNLAKVIPWIVYGAVRAFCRRRHIPLLSELGAELFAEGMCRALAAISSRDQQPFADGAHLDRTIRKVVSRRLHEHLYEMRSIGPRANSIRKRQARLLSCSIDCLADWKGDLTADVGRNISGGLEELIVLIEDKECNEDERRLTAEREAIEGVALQVATGKTRDVIERYLSRKAASLTEAARQVGVNERTMRDHIRKLAPLVRKGLDESGEMALAFPLEVENLKKSSAVFGDVPIDTNRGSVVPKPHFLWRGAPMTVATARTDV